MTYYGERSARDPAWREAQLREAAEREARRRAADPDHVRAIRRRATARCRARQVETGLTLAQLADRCLLDGYPKAEETLRRVLADEVARGTVDYHSTSRRFVLNGGLDLETREALLQLDLPDVDRSRPG